VLIPARILGTGSHLTGRLVTTAEIVAERMPGKDPGEVQDRIGIATRYWAAPGTQAADTGAEALRRALEAAGLAAADLRRVVFVSSTGGDALIPGTAHLVCDRLGLDDTCDAFDVNNSCAGFLTALDLAARSVATGLGPVGIVSAELFSRYLPEDKLRPYLVMGDAAAAAVVGPGRGDEGLLAVSLASEGLLRKRVTMEHPGVTGRPTFLHFDATYAELTDNAAAAMMKSTRRALGEAGVALGDVEWVLPHQPNGRMLEIILGMMEVPMDRTVPVVGEIGSVGSASIPMALDRLFRDGRLRARDRILMTAVGAGTGYGSILYQVGA
jgi:3-oxoacyl-[acyl-carrier-protein] synthase III